MSSPRPPDWQLPVGVTPGLWEYLHQNELATQYLSKVSDSPFAQADQRFVARHLTTPGKVIDLGCGPGRSLLPLVQRGFDCTGIDLSEAMLTEARQVFQQASVIPTFLHANLGERLPVNDHAFDAVLCLFGTLGMLHPDSVQHHLLQEARRIVKPTGLFLLHVHNRWPITGWRWWKSIVTMPVHQGVSNLQMKLYTLHEIRRELHLAGWSIIDVQPVDGRNPDGISRSSRWLTRFQAAGYLLAARPTP